MGFRAVDVDVNGTSADAFFPRLLETWAWNESSEQFCLQRWRVRTLLLSQTRGFMPVTA